MEAGEGGVGGEESTVRVNEIKRRERERKNGVLVHI